MARSKRAVIAFLFFTPGIVCGWIAWWLSLPLTEPLLIDTLGPAGALVLWALLGVSLWVGYRVALMLAKQTIGARLECAA